MSFKPYLIPLSKQRTVKQIKGKAKKKGIPLVFVYVIKNKYGKRYAAVMIDRHYDSVLRTYGTGVTSTVITKEQIQQGHYKVLYQRKTGRRKISRLIRGKDKQSKKLSYSPLREVK